MLSPKEIEILEFAIQLLDSHYDELERTVKRFKWICHAHLPQADTKENDNGYSKNKNVFDIQDKTITDIQKAKAEGREVIMKLINQQ
jgi:hypothetical protein